MHFSKFLTEYTLLNNINGHGGNIYLRKVNLAYLYLPTKCVQLEVI